MIGYLTTGAWLAPGHMPYDTTDFKDFPTPTHFYTPPHIYIYIYDGISH